MRVAEGSDGARAAGEPCWVTRRGISRQADIGPTQSEEAGTNVALRHAGRLRVNRDRWELMLPAGTALVGAGLLVWWLAAPGGVGGDLRQPGQDGGPALVAASPEELPDVEPGEPIRGTGVPSTESGRWPGFRGPNRDGIVESGTRLARAWGPEGPVRQWELTLGEGYASAAISHGCVFVLDYDSDQAADTMRCLSLDTGLPVWTNHYPVLLTRNHGLSRTVPVIAGDLVISFGPRCHVAAWDIATGQCRWLIDLVRDFGATVPRWYAGQCPYVDEGRLILAPSGESLLIAVDVASGEVLWRSPNPRGWEMTHVSVMPMQWQDRRAYLYCGSGGVAAVAADDGSLLWDSPEWPSHFATCPSPLVLPEGRVLLCSGYGRQTGALILQVQHSAEQWSAEPIVRLTPKQFNAEQQTPILYRDHIFAVRKHGGGQLVCLDLQGNEVWNSGSDRFGHGPFLIADDLILVMDDRGQLTMAEADVERYQRLAQAEVFPDGHDAWGPMALVSGRLILRDMTRMACLDLTAGAAP